MSNIEIRKDVAYRDVMFTLDNVLSEISNKVHIDFSDKEKFPALKINTNNEDGSIITPSNEIVASRLDVGRQIYLDGDINGRIYKNGDKTQEGVFDGSENVHLLTDVVSIEGNAVDNFFIRDKETDKLTPVIKYAETVTDKIKDNYIEDIFDYENDSNGTYVKNANKAKEFSKNKIIALTGDVVGDVKTTFTNEKTEITTELFSNYIDITLDSNNWSDINKDYVIDTISTNGKINSNVIKYNSNVIIVPGLNITPIQLEYLQNANIQAVEQEDGMIKLKYFNAKPPINTNIPIRLIIIGKSKEVI